MAPLAAGGPSPMLFAHRFFEPTLAQASYLIGCTRTGRALVIDANRDVETYVRTAAAEGLTITDVTETHIHADFASGSRALAARTGARLHLSDEGDANWKYAFAAEAGARLLTHGDVIEVGHVRVDVVRTPGHTPEHLMFLVTDTATTDEPVAAVTGDFLFVGDVGRPDLLERAAGFAGTMTDAARTLHASLATLAVLPDHLQVWPGHGAGSSCGKGLGALPQTTLGYERRTNWALRVADADAFVARVLDGQPDPPPYFAVMKRLNKLGASARPATTPARMDPAGLERLMAAGVPVFDTRPAEAFAAGHVPGTLNIPLSRGFTSWAGWFVPYDTDLALIVEHDADVETAVRELALIGLDRVTHVMDADGVRAWSAEGRPVRWFARFSPAALAEARKSASPFTVVDVRTTSEFAAGHVPGARNIPLGRLAQQADTLPREEPLVVHCQGGLRSAIAASLLDARGFTQVHDLAGGFAAWAAGGHPVSHDDEPPTGSRS